jgi:uncharacterized membrane protein
MKMSDKAEETVPLKEALGASGTDLLQKPVPVDLPAEAVAASLEVATEELANKNANDVLRGSGSISFNKRVAVWIMDGVGNMWFFWGLACFIFGWMLFGRFIGDNYPWPLMLLIVGGIFQALAMVAIMVGQNVISEHQEIKSDIDHQTLQVMKRINDTQLEILEELRHR